MIQIIRRRIRPHHHHHLHHHHPRHLHHPHHPHHHNHPRHPHHPPHHHRHHHHQQQHHRHNRHRHHHLHRAPIRISIVIAIFIAMPLSCARTFSGSLPSPRPLSSYRVCHLDQALRWVEEIQATGNSGGLDTSGLSPFSCRNTFKFSESASESDLGNNFKTKPQGLLSVLHTAILFNSTAATRMIIILIVTMTTVSTVAVCSSHCRVQWRSKAACAEPVDGSFKSTGKSFKWLSSLSSTTTFGTSFF